MNYRALSPNLCFLDPAGSWGWLQSAAERGRRVGIHDRPSLSTVSGGVAHLPSHQVTRGATGAAAVAAGVQFPEPSWAHPWITQSPTMASHQS